MRLATLGWQPHPGCGQDLQFDPEPSLWEMIKDLGSKVLTRAELVGLEVSGVQLPDGYYERFGWAPPPR